MLSVFVTGSDTLLKDSVLDVSVSFTLASVNETVLIPIASVEKFPIILASAILQKSNMQKTIAKASFLILSISQDF
jgi:hypothetical protein